MFGLSTTLLVDSPLRGFLSLSPWLCGVLYSIWAVSYATGRQRATGSGGCEIDTFGVDWAISYAIWAGGRGREVLRNADAT